MSLCDKIAIIGVGLIGGSIGLALRERRLANEIVGIGRRESSLKVAEQAGAVTTTTTDLAYGVKDARLIVVCTPVGTIVEHVYTAAKACPAGSIITDAGSTKAEIVAALDGKLDRGIAFIGSHPLAGSEKSGPDAADAELFVDRVVITTPTEKTTSAHLNTVDEFWAALGAQVRHMTPQEHDQCVAAVSHFPHVVASALAAVTPDNFLPFAATGWKDTTRIASGDVQLWQQILSQNPDHVLKSLDKFEEWLARFRSALAKGDSSQLTKLLEAGKQSRGTVGN